jgi:hypothetical protein
MSILNEDRYILRENHLMDKNFIKIFSESKIKQTFAGIVIRWFSLKMYLSSFKIDIVAKNRTYLK